MCVCVQYIYIYIYMFAVCESGSRALVNQLASCPAACAWSGLDLILAQPHWNESMAAQAGPKLRRERNAHLTSPFHASGRLISALERHIGHKSQENRALLWTFCGRAPKGSRALYLESAPNPALLLPSIPALTIGGWQSTNQTQRRPPPANVKPAK